MDAAFYVHFPIQEKRTGTSLLEHFTLEVF